jgi:ubiquinone/menaquinone biosynthesis C-methylase UbiE
MLTSLDDEHKTSSIPNQIYIYFSFTILSIPMNIKSIVLRTAKLFQIMSFKPTPTYSSNYERMLGNCTRILAAQMILTVDPPITSSSYILDNSCGPGIVSEQIKLLHPDTKIMAADLAPEMIDQVQQAIKANDWSSMQTEILDIRDLSILKDDSFTYVITNFGLPFPADLGSGPKITKEMFRILKMGGVALISTWAGET